MEFIIDVSRPAKRGKEARTWSDGKVTKAEAKELNRSEPVDTSSVVNGEQLVDVSSHSGASTRVCM